MFVLMGQCWFRLATIDGYGFCYSLDTTLALHMKHMKLQQKNHNKNAVSKSAGVCKCLVHRH